MKHTGKTVEAPLQHIYDLGDLGQAGAVVTVVAEDLAALAAWTGVDSVEKFSAEVTLRRLSQTHFSFSAELTAEITQACVVTLEPVNTRIERTIARELHFEPRTQAADLQSAGELTLAAGDDDVPEAIASLHYDLAAPLLEEFSLAIDPYPRKAGAVFDTPGDAEVPQSSPFAVLKALKDRG